MQGLIQNGGLFIARKAISLASHTMSLPCLCRSFSEKEKQKDITDDYGRLSAQYCINLVQKHDHENYLSTLLIGKEMRRQAFALRAFNVEVSKSISNVSEEHISKMRLKFWHDSIDKCYETQQLSYVSDQPVLRELQQAVATKNISKFYLKRLVTARDRGNNEPFETTHELEDYADRTNASLLHLLIELYGIRDIQVDHAASHLGKAQGIATMLRSIPYTGRWQAVTIPLDILLRNGVSQERILRGAPHDKGVKDCVFEVASVANQHLQTARNLAKNIPKQLCKLFLPAVATERYLERLRKADFHPYKMHIWILQGALTICCYAFSWCENNCNE